MGRRPRGFTLLQCVNVSPLVAQLAGDILEGDGEEVTFLDGELIFGRVY